MVRNVTKAEAFAPGFAAAFSVSGLEGSGMTAAATWRPTTAGINPAAGNSAAAHSAAANAAALKPAMLRTQIKQYTQIKQHVVTTPDAGRGNKGTSPWGFPV